MIAGAALAASGGSSMPVAGPMEVRIPYSPQRDYVGEKATYRRRVVNDGIAQGRVGGNQRQKRKDRRRAFANGNRRAFR